MKKMLAAGVLAVLAVLGSAGAAQAAYVYEAPASSTTNQESYWGENCTKTEFADGVTSVNLTGRYSTVVVKAGRTITVYTDFYGGMVASMSGKDISHLIVCPAPKPQS